MTYQADIRPLIEANCAGCHSGDDGIAPFPLTSFAEVEAVGGIAVAAVEARQMPPWGMDDSCRDVRGSLWLSDEEVALFSAWRDADYPEGDAEDYVAPDLPEVVEAPRAADTVVEMAPYAPDTSGPDDYRCLVLGDPTAQDIYVTGTQVRPGNLAVAHHAILYAIPPAELSVIAALEDQDADPGFTCFGDPGSEGATFVAGWAPGGQGYRPLPGGAALRVAAGSQFVLQMHYNTLGAGPGDTDATAIDLWTLPPDVLPDELLIPWPVAHLGISVPAGVTSVQRTTNRIPIEGRIVSVSPHMHVLGSELQTTLTRSDGAQECLADVPQYDFQWQRGYGFVEPLDVGWSDAIEIACTYDNTAENQPVVDGAQVQPTDVAWGEGTLDEMCLNYVSVVTPFYGEGTGAVCDGYAACSEGCDPGDPFCRMACMSSAGESCFNCGVDGLFGSCAISACTVEAIGVGDCMEPCSPYATDALECMYERCGDEMRAYWACAEPVVDAGDCADDYAACPSLSGIDAP